MLITVDGIDGCGKSTQIARLKSNLENRNYIVRTFSDLGSSQFGITTRKLINSTNLSDPLVDVLLIYAARLENIEKNIIPALARNEIVLADRFSLSTLVYNILGRDVSPKIYDFIESHIVEKLKPSLSIFIDTDVDICLSRVGKRPNGLEKYESFGRSYFQNAQKQFQSCCNAGLAERIDGAGTIEDVEERINLALAKHLGL
jgi:dTMP kinase